MTEFRPCDHRGSSRGGLYAQTGPGADEGSTSPVIGLGGRYAEFGIDGSAPFFGGYDYGRGTWNGWAVPAFDPGVVVAIIRELDPDPDVVWWDGSVLMCDALTGDGPVPIYPDGYGRYTFDGWCWLEREYPATAPLGES